MPVLQPPAPISAEIRSEWLLDPKIAFLNHGSFGAVPKCVLVEQTRWRMRIEAEPVELLGRRAATLLEQARQPVGHWLGMGPNDFGLVTNATDGINAVLQSLAFKPGDELLTTTHVYNAVRQAMTHAAGHAGASYREIDIPLPIQSSSQIADRVISGLTPATRLLVVDHITSPTAIVFPVEQIAAECRRCNVELLIDGAHAPGMLPLNVTSLGATYYAGNLHKWACAPKGSGFLWVRHVRQPDVHPLVVSHYLGEGFEREFGWQGTRDMSGWLAIPRALEFMSAIGWEKIMAHNHAMAAWVQQMLCEAWDVEPITPVDGSLLGSMATVALPGALSELTESAAATVQQELYDAYRIEAPLMRWGGRTYVRPCCQIYNMPEEYERLASAIKQMAASARQ